MYVQHQDKAMTDIWIHMRVKAGYTSTLCCGDNKLSGKPSTITSLQQYPLMMSQQRF